MKRILFCALSLVATTTMTLGQYVTHEDCPSVSYQDFTLKDAFLSGDIELIYYVMGNVTVDEPQTPSVLTPAQWQSVLDAAWPSIQRDLAAGLSLQQMVNRSFVQPEENLYDPEPREPDVRYPTLTPNTEIPTDYPADIARCFTELHIENVYECVDRAQQFCIEYSRLYPNDKCYIFYYYIQDRLLYGNSAGHALPLVRRQLPNGQYEFCIFDPEQVNGGMDPLYCWRITPTADFPDGDVDRFSSSPACDQEFRRTLWPRLIPLIVPEGNEPPAPSPNVPNQWREWRWRYIINPFSPTVRPDRRRPWIPEIKEFWWECVSNPNDLKQVCDYFNERGLACPGVSNCDDLKGTPCNSPGTRQACRGADGNLTFLNCCTTAYHSYGTVGEWCEPEKVTAMDEIGDSDSHAGVTKH